jgi:hypothetical protein
VGSDIDKQNSHTDMTFLFTTVDLRENTPKYSMSKPVVLMNKCTLIQNRQTCTKKYGSDNVETIEVKDHLHLYAGTEMFSNVNCN